MRANEGLLRIAFIGMMFLAGLNIPVLGDEQALPDGFLNGSYIVIGKRPDSNKTYRGKIDFEEVDGQIHINRVISNKENRGIGEIEKAAGGEAEVLRIQFVEDGNSYEGTYLIDGDLDNYARLTGHIYLKDGSTRHVGFEALFADHGQLARR